MENVQKLYFSGNYCKNVTLIKLGFTPQQFDPTYIAHTPWLHCGNLGHLPITHLINLPQFSLPVFRCLTFFTKVILVVKYNLINLT